jgi:hypothetical protein
VPDPTSADFESLLPDDENGRMLRKMRRNGVDMDRLHPIDFFFEFPSEASATAFHREENEPLATDACIRMDDKWIVRVTKFLIPTHRSINEFQERLIHLAAAHHGKCGGWGYE